MKRFTPYWLPGMLEKMGMEEEVGLESGMLGRALEQAQQKVEAFHFDTRKHLVDYDDVINRQREVIYEERNKILDGGEKVEAIGLGMIRDEVFETVMAYGASGMLEEKEEDALWTELHGVVPLDDFDEEELAGASLEEIVEAVNAYSESEYEWHRDNVGEEMLRDMVRVVLLRSIDRLWVQHLTEMDTFRQGVGLQAYGQQDPLVTYKREAFDMFDQLTANIRRETARALTRMPKRPVSQPGSSGGPRAAQARPTSRAAKRVAKEGRVAVGATAAVETGPQNMTRQQRRAQARRHAAVGVGAASGAATAADSVGVQAVQERHGDDGAAQATPKPQSQRPKKRKKKRR